MNGGVSEKVQEFHKRHGSECYSDGAFRYYANGATREVDPLGALIDPPSPATKEGEWLLASNQLRFAQLKLKAAVDEFEKENEHLCHWAPLDEDAALANLRRLQRVIDERKQLVAVAEQRLSNTRSGKARMAQQRREQEARQRFLTFQEKRRAIRV